MIVSVSFPWTLDCLSVPFISLYFTYKVVVMITRSIKSNISIFQIEVKLSASKLSETQGEDIEIFLGHAVTKQIWNHVHLPEFILISV